ncbi:hypothetical protein [Jidongwangia harbinensis]|uniref:hypothetical protein n=1 Tax=Jidongwangia harbinensis TaxID=2878561 RepID=UPI001CD92162|nr:hypothetical protein [Jidongwangia harbinensis]MCA2219009.1 hypothetical protein [Jidongwangia harbinensis]
MSARDGGRPYARLVRPATAVAAALILALAAYLVIRILVRLVPMTMAIIVALLLAALLGPVTAQLRRWEGCRQPCRPSVASPACSACLPRCHT